MAFPNANFMLRTWCHNKASNSIQSNNLIHLLTALFTCVYTFVLCACACVHVSLSVLCFKLFEMPLFVLLFDRHETRLQSLKPAWIILPKPNSLYRVQSVESKTVKLLCGWIRRLVGKCRDGETCPPCHSAFYLSPEVTKNKSCGFQCLELAGCRVPPCSGLMLSRNPSTTALREGKGPKVSMNWEPLKDGLPASGETVHICSRCDPCLGPSTLLMVLQGASVWKADGRDRPEAMARGKSNSHTFWASTMVRK